MEAAEGWDKGEVESWPGPLARVIGSFAATMVWSQDWYREEQYLAAGAPSLETFVDGTRAFFESWKPIDLYAQTLTWMAADVSANTVFNGDLDAAFAAIEAPALIMPCDTDMYFRVADNEAEVAKMPNAQLKVIRSSWGHMAGMPGANAEDDAFVDAALKELLQK